MPRRCQLILAALVIPVCLLALYQLLVLQYELGDAYPEYSSFRADPLGTLALYDALGSLPETTTRRNMTNLDQAVHPSDATLLFAGALLGKDQVSTLERLESFAAGGGQLIILFRPYLREPSFLDAEESDEEERSAGEEEESESVDSEVEGGPDREPNENGSPGMLALLSPQEDISERWGFDYGYERLVQDENEEYVERVQRGAVAPEVLPQSLPWHSGLYFAGLDESWGVIYARDDRPVAMERDWGSGRIVIATDSFLVTNEAMLSGRESEFLAWLVGTSDTVIFEETHLGVARTTGLMGLLLHYRLVPVLLVLIFLTLLSIWKNAASLVPRHASEQDADLLDADTSVSGMARLAKRAVAPSAVLDTCWELYRQPTAHKAVLEEQTRSSIRQILSANRERPRLKKDNVSTYNRIRSILNER